jgi:hypothetical protein
VQNICIRKAADKDQLKIHTDSNQKTASETHLKNRMKESSASDYKSLEKGNLKRHNKFGHDGIKKFDTIFVINISI